MSLRLIISFIVFVLLTVYFTFLNPGEIEIRLTQSITLPIPVTVFLLGSVLIGALLTSVFTGFHQIKSSLQAFLKTRSWQNQTRRQKKCEQLYQKAENAIAGEHRDKAFSFLNKTLDEDPNHVSSLILLGDLYREKGKLEQALEKHQKAVNLDRENVRALQGLAEDYATAGKPNKSIEALKQARQLEPDSLAILRKLREAYRKQGAWNLVLQIQKSILSQVSTTEDREREKEYSGQIAYLRGCELLQQQQMEPAYSEFKRAIREYPPSPPPYIQLGDLYQQNGDLKAAIKIWKSGYDNTGSHICLLRLRAAYQQMQKPDEIIKLYREAIQRSRNSEKETLVLTLAEFYLNHGQKEEAMKTLWDISSPSIPAHLLLVKAHQDNNEMEKADLVIRSALQKVNTSLSRFVCRECNKEFEQWTAVCPECQAWNSFDTALNHSL
ncbi:MAG: tetratricopeptide repeat protein [Nitrospinota bacterium]|nr:tetratricopeptide repeat protein [Nitrospinota bacterium]